MRERELVEARFRWAKQHLKTLEGEVRAYLDGKPYSLKVHVNRERMEYTFRVRVTKTIPEDWPFIIGDILHNLRSTLDNLVFNLAGSPAGKRSKLIQFPIVHPGRKGGRPAFDRVAPTRLAGVRRDPKAIIEDVQPYHGLRRLRFGRSGSRPPHPLSVLNYMSNIDKHRTPHIGFASIREVTIHSSVSPTEFVTFSGRLLEDNTVVARCKFPRPVTPDVDVHRPIAQLELALKIPWGRRGYKIVPFHYLNFMGGLIERDIMEPLRPFMK